MSRRRALVICPGRGTYNRDELGYLGRHHAGKRDLLDMVDGYRARLGKPTVSALDGAKRFSAATHVRGDNASPLIHTCAYADFLDIDRDGFDVVAVTGNSMGWYIALACAGSMQAEAGLAIVDTMGWLMHEHGVGGQLVYPLVGEDWRESPGRRGELMELLAEIDNRPGHSASLSIDLGGMLVFAADEPGLAALIDALPKLGERYPMRLPYHAAFHSVLQSEVAIKGREALREDLFAAPAIPLIDGRGQIWRPRETRPVELRDYTLGAQVVAPYDFARAVRTGLREFAPDALIVLGPGTTLGGAVAQVLVGEQWLGMTDKASFQSLQRDHPFMLSMALPEQRELASGRQAPAPLPDANKSSNRD